MVRKRSPYDYNEDASTLATDLGLPYIDFKSSSTIEELSFILHSRRKNTGVIREQKA